MNLIQVQERLKDLPLQAIAAYANGANPNVEPFMALMEMQRRRRMEQQAQPAEAPTGTIKDQIEQQAGLAALQQMRMGQAQQQMMQGAAAQPMPVPEGAPQPEQQPQPEMTGIANAAAQPGVMQPGVMGMAGGGIVAFARGGSEDDGEEDEDDEDEDEDEEEAGAGYGGVDTGEFPAETYAVADQPTLNARDLERFAAIGVTPFAPPTGPGLRLPPQAAAAPRPAQPAAAPQGLQSIAQQLADRQAQAAQQRAAVPQAPQMPTRESMARENPAMYGVLNKPVGQDYLTGLQALLAKQAAEDPKAMEQLERNKRMDFYKALIAAGEGTRGQKGLRGLGAGFGKAMIPAMEARGQEEAGIRGQALKRDELLNKAKFDVEKFQRAQGEGDLKAEQKSKQDLFKSAVELYKSGNTSLAKEIGALAGIREAEIRAAATEQSAKIRAAAKSAGAGAEKPTDQERGVMRYYEAMVAEGAPKGPVTLRNAQEMYLRGRGVASLESTSARRDRDIAQMLSTAEIMAFGELAKMSEAEKRTWRANKRREIEADYEAGRYRLQRTPEAPTAPTTAPAPGASSRPPPPPGFR